MLQALQVFTWGQRVSASLVLAAALLAAAAPASGHAHASTWTILAIVAVVGTTASWQCSVIKQKFVFVDYVHADR